jgi:hypothetical protein
MLLKNSIAIALFATSSLISLSAVSANTDDSLLDAANEFLELEERTVSKSTGNVVNAIISEMQKPDIKQSIAAKEDTELDSAAAVLLGVTSPPQLQPQYYSPPAPVQVSQHIPQYNQSQAAQTHQQRLLNKRKRENLQRLHIKKRRLNQQKLLLRLA